MILIVYKPSGVINVGTTFSQRGGGCNQCIMHIIIQNISRVTLWIEIFKGIDGLNTS